MTDEANVSVAGEEHTRAPAPQAPTGAELRRLIRDKLRGDSVLVGFALDYFPSEVHRHFSDGMDRVAKENLLIQHADPHKLYEALQGVRWIYVPRAWRWTLSWAAGALGVTALIMAVIVYWIPSEGALGPAKGGVVIAGRWVGTPAGKGLCATLKNLDAHHAVVCEPTRFIAERAEGVLQDRARSAGALVVATVEGERMQIQALGRLDGDPLFRFPVSLGLVDDLERVAVLLKALARAAAPEPDAEIALGIPCPDFGTRTLDQVGLRTRLAVPACEGRPLAMAQYLGLCEKGDEHDRDEDCALGRYLFGLDHPRDPQAREPLQKVVDHGPERLRRAATVALLREDCRLGPAKEVDLQGWVDAAALRLSALSEGASPCERIRFAGLAACVVFQAGQSRARLDEAVTRLEQTSVGDEDTTQCPREQLGQALATRGFWRFRREQWIPAARDYEQAYPFQEEPRHLLTAAEARLHVAGQADQVRALLEQAKPRIDLLERKPQEYAQADGPAARFAPDRRRSVDAALLRWEASRQKGDPDEQRKADAELVELYHRLDGGTPPIAEADEDPDLEKLVCRGRNRCVYRALESPSPQVLMGILDAGTQ